MSVSERESEKEVRSQLFSLLHLFVFTFSCRYNIFIPRKTTKTNPTCNPPILKLDILFF